MDSSKAVLRRQITDRVSFSTTVDQCTTDTWASGGDTCPGGGAATDICLEGTNEDLCPGGGSTVDSCSGGAPLKDVCQGGLSSLDV
jgi:hypothetical protein